MAYADFVTAIMALFLVLWIMSQKPESRGELADYFRKRMLSSATANPHGGSSVLQARDKESDTVPATSSVFENLSAVPLDFIRKNADDLARALLEDPTWGQNGTMKVEHTKDGLLVSFFDTPERPLFSSGSAALGEYGRIAFESLAWELARHPVAELELNGHTAGETGSADSDAMDVSTARANAVRRVLLAQGVKPAQIKKISGLGSGSPLPGRSAADPTNRRVSILIRVGPDKNPR